MVILQKVKLLRHSLTQKERMGEFPSREKATGIKVCLFHFIVSRGKSG